MPTRVIAALLAATVIAVPALALTQDGHPHHPRMGMGPGAMVDADKDGVVTREEVLANVADRFAKMDRDKDGKLSAEERVPEGRHGRMAGRMADRAEKRGIDPAQLRERAHDRLDTDNDGAISLEEQRVAALRRFDMADGNKDGKIDQAERIALRDRMMAMGPMGHRRGPPPPPPPPPPAPAPNAPNGE